MRTADQRGARQQRIHGKVQCAKTYAYYKHAYEEDSPVVHEGDARSAERHGSERDAKDSGARTSPQRQPTERNTTERTDEMDAQYDAGVR
jgi:hypothetical protein